jgi:hypothetical protein
VCVRTYMCVDYLLWVCARKKKQSSSRHSLLSLSTFFFTSRKDIFRLSLTVFHAMYTIISLKRTCVCVRTYICVDYFLWVYAHRRRSKAAADINFSLSQRFSSRLEKIFFGFLSLTVFHAAMYVVISRAYMCVCGQFFLWVCARKKKQSSSSRVVVAAAQSINRHI